MWNIENTSIEYVNIW